MRAKPTVEIVPAGVGVAALPVLHWLRGAANIFGGSVYERGAGVRQVIAYGEQVSHGDLVPFLYEWPYKKGKPWSRPARRIGRRAR